MGTLVAYGPRRAVQQARAVPPPPPRLRARTPVQQCAQLFSGTAIKAREEASVWRGPRRPRAQGGEWRQVRTQRARRVSHVRASYEICGPVRGSPAALLAAAAAHPATLPVGGATRRPASIAQGRNTGAPPTSGAARHSHCLERRGCGHVAPVPHPAPPSLRTPATQCAAASPPAPPPSAKRAAGGVSSRAAAAESCMTRSSASCRHGSAGAARPRPPWSARHDASASSSVSARPPDAAPRTRNAPAGNTTVPLGTV